MSRVPLPPVPVLLAVLLINLCIAAGAAWYALQHPWLGVQLAADEHSVSVEKAQGPSRALASGSRLLALESADLSTRIEVHPSDLVEEPDSFNTYPELAAFFQRQDALAALLRQPEVRLHWQTREGELQSALLAPQHRPLGDLPAVFWFQLLAGITGCMIGCWVWVLRPRDWGARMFALTGMMFPVFSISAAIYSTRELALPGTAFQLLSGLNHTGAILFGCALAGIFLSYPKMLVKPRHLLWLPAVFGAFLLADLLRVAPGMDWGYRIPVMSEMLLTIALAAAQWRMSRSRPLERAALRWLMLSVIVGSGLFIFLTAGHELFGLLPPMSQGYSFGFFLIMYAGIALGLQRYRLFELDKWAYRILLWMGGALLVIVLDALFIAVLRMNPALSLGVTLLTAGLVYFPLRQWLWRRYVAPPHATPQEMMSELIRIAFLTSPGEREAQWDALLHRFFAPLQLTHLAGAEDRPRLIDDGLALHVPACGGLAARALRYPSRGNRLFSSDDVEFADSLRRLMDHAAAGRDAYERGALAERHRIARDMHDDVGARLLMLIHRTRDSETASLARAAMSDLRTAITALDAQPIPLHEALADWRAEMQSRCEAAGVAANWHEPELLPERQLSPWQRATLEKVLREALTNALKHAAPQQVEVTVEPGDALLSIRVANDGHPLPPERWAEGRGLRNMRARLGEVGGDLAVERPDERRVVLKITLPLAA